MARKKELRKIKTKKSKKKFIIIVIILLVLCIGGFLTYTVLTNTKKKKVNVKILDSIEKYGYSISDKDSELYKTEFNNLKKILNEKEVDTQKYSEQVARLFAIDLYSLNTKINKYDVGGSPFFYSTKEEMYKTKVMDTLYSTMQDNTYGDRKQELPEVTEVKTENVKEDTYIFIDNSQIVNNVRTCPEGFEISKNDNSKCTKNADKVYIIELTWKYAKDMGYDDEGSFVVAPDVNNKWSIVEYRPKLHAFD